MSNVVNTLGVTRKILLANVHALMMHKHGRHAPVSFSGLRRNASSLWPLLSGMF